MGRAKREQEKTHKTAQYLYGTHHLDEYFGDLGQASPAVLGSQLEQGHGGPDVGEGENAHPAPGFERSEPGTPPRPSYPANPNTGRDSAGRGDANNPGERG
jgi:hypothetical protein